MMYGEPAPPGITALRKHVNAHPRSPLAVRYAHALIEAGEYRAALEVCRNAAEFYPEHPSLRLVTAQAQTALRQFGPARVILKQLLAELPACFAASKLLVRIERLEKQSLLEGGRDNKGIPDAGFSPPEQSERQKKTNWSWSEHLIPGEDAILSKRAKDFETRLPQQEPKSRVENTGAEDAGTDKPFEERVFDEGEDKTENLVSSDFDFSVEFPEGLDAEDTDLEALAGQLDSASMPRITGSDEGEDDGESGPAFEAVNLEARPATETLAEIYVKQGKLAEAIDAYRKLREQNRDKRYEYTVRISEIKRLIDEREGNR